MNKYYRITSDIDIFWDEWQLQRWIIIEDVWTNMFVAKSMDEMMRKQSQQLNMRVMDLVKVLIKHSSPLIQII